MIKTSLKNHPYASCYIREHDNGDIDFISYSTRVITVSRDENKNRIIECTGTYSATTRKQIGWFCKEYVNDLCYHDMKNIVGKGFIIL